MNHFGWWPALIPLLFVVIAWVGGDAGAVAVYLGFNLVLNLPHQYATWRRVVIERRFDRHWFIIAGTVVAGLTLITVVIPTDWRDRLLNDGFVYWGLHHLAAQHVGISRVLTRRDGRDPGSATWDWCFNGGVMVLAACWLHVTTSMHYEIFGHPVDLLRIPLPLAALPYLQVGILGSAGSLVLWRSRHWRTARTCATYEGAMLLGTIIALASPSLLATIAGLTAMHNVHYLAIVGRQQAGYGHPWNRADGWRIVGYVAAVHLAFLLALPFGRLCFAILVSWHYLADARLWHSRRDPVLARQLTTAVPT